MLLNRGMRALAVVAVLLLAVGVRAQDRPTLDVRQFTLGNGLHVILAADRSAPTVAVNITTMSVRSTIPPGAAASPTCLSI
jgi:hypothetical protein